MKCPFCGEEMREGYIEFDPRAGLTFHDEGDEKLPVLEQVDKQVTLVSYQFTTMFSRKGCTMPASHCEACKKTILHGD
jgi:hypothetical protein